jgi:acetylglutamate/LysW-gamma-L-alpha-aminoadipate kinase
VATAGTIVVKVGGSIVADRAALRRVLEDIAGLPGEARVVLVHGGGGIVTEYSRRMGVEPRFVVSPSGVRSRYTSLEELEVYVMVMAGKVNKEVTAALQSMGVEAIGVSGVDCGLLRAVRRKRIVVLNERGRPQVVPGGYTGRITMVNTACLQALTSTARVLVVAPVALGEEGEMLNVDGDQAASRIAAALKASHLLLLTDTPGVMVDGRLVGRLKAEEARRLASRVGYGMNRKLIEASWAVANGVGRAVIASGRREKPVQKALEGHGTIIEA